MFCGIEIGGTKLQLGIGPGHGILTALHRETIDAQGGAPAILDQIKRALPEILTKTGTKSSDLLALGIGFGGPVDDMDRCTITSHQVKGWDRFPLAKWCEQQFQIQTFLGNDADVAGLAEAHYGAGIGYSPIFYITVGSGIGGALILDGKIHRGTGVGAGEIGHLWVDYDLDSKQPEVSPDERWKITEHRASGWAISKAAQMADVQTLALAVRQGDQVATKVLRLARRRLALAISHLIALICPRRIIIGGGVSLLGDDLWLQPIRDEVRSICFKPFQDCYEIVPAALKEEVVLHGAIALAKLGLASSTRKGL